MSDTKKKKDEKRKKQKSILEDEIFAFMQKSTKSAIDAALNDILKEWK